MPVFNYTDSNNRQIFSTFVNETLTLKKLFSLKKIHVISFQMNGVGRICQNLLLKMAISW